MKKTWPILAELLVLLCTTTFVLHGTGTYAKPVWSAFDTCIVVDAGHGGIDGGSVGVTGVVEKDLNLDIAKKCELLLNFFGVQTVMTRTTDDSLDDGSGSTIAARKADDIHKRTAIANQAGNALISIHMNSFTDRKYYGAQTFYSKNNTESKIFAEKLQECLRSGLDPDNDRESKQAVDSIYLMKHVTVPAVIVECGFLSNVNEEALLSQDEYRTRCAVCITKGTLDYLTEELE